MINKLKSVGYITPPNNLRGTKSDKHSLYTEEKKILKQEFASIGPNIDWTDNVVNSKLKAFAKQVIEVATDSVNQVDLINLVLPTETIEPGDTLVFDEVSGVNIYYGTYGAAVRMSRPQFTKYTATTNLKEAGLKLQLAQIQAGKYSASELGEYTANLISAWRNRLLFTTTLAGMTQYQSGGAQYESGASLTASTVLAAIADITDESDVKLIVGRRAAIHQLSTCTPWSEAGKREWETQGQVGSYAGIPVLKVNSFTDNDYGQVYPMPSDELWLFSELPAGRAVVAAGLRTSEETVLRNETLNIYFRWDDGFGIWHTDRIARIASIT